MSRIRIVKGKFTEVVGKDYNIYSASSIVDNALGTITMTGEKKGVTYGNPEKPSEINIYPKKIVFRPKKISPKKNILAVVENIENILKEGDDLFICGRKICDNWTSLSGKLYLIPQDMSLYGTTFFKVNGETYQSIQEISNCITSNDYINSFEEQMQILKEFIEDIEASNLRYKSHIKDRISYDAYYRLVKCIKETENYLANTSEYNEFRDWVDNKFD